MKYFDDEVASYTCCDSEFNNNNNLDTNVLNDIKCVPYQNKDYLPIYHNAYGSIITIDKYCNNLETGFIYINGHYRCCKGETKQGLNPFVQDTAFKASVYSQLMLSSIAVIPCAVLIVALLKAMWLR